MTIDGPKVSEVGSIKLTTNSGIPRCPKEVAKEASGLDNISSVSAVANRWIAAAVNWSARQGIKQATESLREIGEQIISDACAERPHLQRQWQAFQEDMLKISARIGTAPT